MKKIMVIGSPGAGKSTFAFKLSEKTHIELFHIDKLFWKPNWIHISTDELQEKLKEIMALDSWIIDGNYSGTMEMRLREADTVIWLNYSIITCLYGIIKRKFMYKSKARPDITDGCKENLNWEFFKFVITFHLCQKKKTHKILDGYSQQNRVIIFKKRKDANKFLDE